MHSVPRRETRWTGFRKIFKSVAKFGNRLTGLTDVLASLEVELFSEEFKHKTTAEAPMLVIGGSVFLRRATYSSGNE
jgi:hypothetical protein